ncbi:hypothetical protein MMC10_011298 [Thelotrema lepadinum]|nr:hypothetical protein [Thelotrema lepadinum]
MCESDTPEPSQRHDTPGQLKRKREDFLIASTPHTSDAAKVGWDKVTYRITRIPEEFDLPRLSQAIKSLFELEDAMFKLHSLAIDATDETEPRTKVATISFRTIPARLQSSLHHADEWDFDIPLSPTDPTNCSRIYLDTHFKGFTPLSPAERDGEYTIE